MEVTYTALELWTRSARGGVFSGLASNTWVTLKTETFDAGIALYEEYYEIRLSRVVLEFQFGDGVRSIQLFETKPSEVKA